MYVGRSRARAPGDWRGVCGRVAPRVASCAAAPSDLPCTQTALSIPQQLLLTLQVILHLIRQEIRVLKIVVVNLVIFFTAKIVTAFLVCKYQLYVVVVRKFRLRLWVT